MIAAALALSFFGLGAHDELEPRLYRAHMAAAESAIRLGDFAAARAWSCSV